MKKAGSSLGSGAVIVMDETTCMVRVLERLSRFYMSESCGQCTPCREGTGWLDRMLKRIVPAQARREDLELLLDVANRIEGHTICALGDAAAWPVQSFLKHFRHEFEYMIEHKAASSSEATVPLARRLSGSQHERGTGQHRGQRRAGEGPQGRDDHRATDRERASTSRASAITRSCRSRPTAACAWCEVEKAPKPLPACATPVDRRHEDLHAVAARRSARSARRWSSC